MFSDLSVLLPSHSLDDFPTHLRGEQASGLLAACTALWHPALIAAAGKLPRFERADEPSENFTNRVILVPNVANDMLPDGYLENARQHGALAIEVNNGRAAIVATLLTALKAKGVPDTSELASPGASDFFALGFSHLQIELLTRRMRYSSHLNDDRFQADAVAAAQAWMAGNSEEAKLQLSKCYDLLLEARGHFYPVDTYFIEITLVNPSTTGQSLRDELTSGVPTNLLLSANTLLEMASREPEALAGLRAAVEADAVGIIGGEFLETELPLLGHESIAAQIEFAAAVYQQHLGRRPVVFGRRRAGLTPVLPQILQECGFIGALHILFDEGRVPQFDRTKTRWEGIDSNSIDALDRLPLDAASDESCLALSEELGNTMDRDFVATVLFAHWPGHTSTFHNDLRCAAANSPVLGKFVTVDAYFRETESAGVYSKFPPDEYRTAYLQQAAATGAAQSEFSVSDPILSSVRFTHRHAKHQAAQAVQLMTNIVSGAIGRVALPELAEFEIDGWRTSPEKSIELDKVVDQALESGAQALAAAMPKITEKAEQGFYVINPLNFARKIAVENGMVDVPSMGFAWLSANAGAISGHNGGTGIAMENGETLVLVNDYCEVKIARTSGAIQSVRDLKSRGNRLSQQLAIRLPESAALDETRRKALQADADDTPYTKMVADSVRVKTDSAYLGAIEITGRMINTAGESLAGFSEIISLAQGSRVVQLEIAIRDVSFDFTSDPWNSYLACRFAWPDETAAVRRSVHGCSFATDAKRIEAPLYVELESGGNRTGIITGGLPYHRRIGRRMLDCLLHTRGAHAGVRQIRLGLAIDAPHPWRAAQELLAPQIVVPFVALPVGDTSGWLFHTDLPHVAATHWSPLVETNELVGFRVRLLETEGRRGQLKLRACRLPKRAQRTALDGQILAELPTENDAVLLDINPYEWNQIDVFW